MEIVAPPKASKHFETPHESLADLDPDVAATLIAAAADVALVIDPDGVIRDISFGNEDLLNEGGDVWLGRKWSETVTVESRSKIEDLLKTASSAAPTRWRQVNHPSPRGPDLPVSYCTVRVGTEGRIVAIGRDLRSLAMLQKRLADAQQAMEREYARIRGAETRYRILFQLAGEAILIVDATTNRVTELNPAASRLLGRDAKRLVSRGFADLFEQDNVPAIQSLMAAVRVAGRVDDVHALLSEGRQPVLVSASLFRQEKFAYFLVRVSPLSSGTGESVPRGRASLLSVVESLPEGLAVTDSGGRILTANGAFLDLVQMATEEQVRGEPLSRWIGRPAVDFDVLLSNLREHGSVRHFATIVRGEYGSVEEVEIAAVSVPNGEQPCLGFTVRAVGWRRTPSGGTQTSSLPRSPEQFTELVGRVALKDLVRETTDMIERLCIEAALEMTRDNRASAAEILGLSRQALYAKLRRYGLGDLDGPE